MRCPCLLLFGDRCCGAVLLLLLLAPGSCTAGFAKPAFFTALTTTTTTTTTKSRTRDNHNHYHHLTLNMAQQRQYNQCYLQRSSPSHYYSKNVRSCSLIILPRSAIHCRRRRRTALTTTAMNDDLSENDKNSDDDVTNSAAAAQQVGGGPLRRAVRKFRARPGTYLLIPCVAAVVGWVTNWLAVQMIFYPIQFRGIPIKQWNEVPLGLLGWQGIVPCKTRPMSEAMVELVSTQLMSVKEVFGRLDPKQVAKLLGPRVPVMMREILREIMPLQWMVGLPGAIFNGLDTVSQGVLQVFNHQFLVQLTKSMQANIGKLCTSWFTLLRRSNVVCCGSRQFAIFFIRALNLSLYSFTPRDFGRRDFQSTQLCRGSNVTGSYQTR